MTETIFNELYLPLILIYQMPQNFFKSNSTKGGFVLNSHCMMSCLQYHSNFTGAKADNHSRDF